MITVAPLAARDAVAFGHLTFPLFRSLLAEAGTLAIGAACAGQPVGLALARAGREAELLSIAVAGPWRRRGVAGRLLAELEVRLAACGSERLSAAKSAAPHAPDVLNALLALGYNSREAAAATRDLPPDLALADAIRQALKVLAKP